MWFARFLLLSSCLLSQGRVDAGHRIGQGGSHARSLLASIREEIPHKVVLLRDLSSLAHLETERSDCLEIPYEVLLHVDSHASLVAAQRDSVTNCSGYVFHDGEAGAGGSGYEAIEIPYEYFEDPAESLSFGMKTLKEILDAFWSLKNQVNDPHPVGVDSYDAVDNNCATFVLAMMDALKIEPDQRFVSYSATQFNASPETVAAVRGSKNLEPLLRGSIFTEHADSKHILEAAINKYIDNRHTCSLRSDPVHEESKAVSWIRQKMSEVEADYVSKHKNTRDLREIQLMSNSNHGPHASKSTQSKRRLGEQSTTCTLGVPPLGQIYNFQVRFEVAAPGTVGFSVSCGSKPPEDDGYFFLPLTPDVQASTDPRDPRLNFTDSGYHDIVQSLYCRSDEPLVIATSGDTAHLRGIYITGATCYGSLTDITAYTPDGELYVSDPDGENGDEQFFWVFEEDSTTTGASFQVQCLDLVCPDRDPPDGLFDDGFFYDDDFSDDFSFFFELFDDDEYFLFDDDPVFNDDVTDEPTDAPSKNPTAQPTKSPSKMPTSMPTKNPTPMPTETPTMNPTDMPTKTPTSTRDCQLAPEFVDNIPIVGDLVNWLLCLFE